MRAAKRHLIFLSLSFLCQAISNTLGISGFAPASPRITSPAREGGELWLRKNGVLSKKTTSFSQDRDSNRYLPLATIKFNLYYSNSLIQYRISTFLNECNTHLARFPAYSILAPVGGRLWDHDTRRFFMQERENVVFLCGPRDHGQMSVLTIQATLLFIVTYQGRNFEDTRAYEGTKKREEALPLACSPRALYKNQ